MKKIFLSLFVVFVFLLILGYILPVSPSMVAIGGFFAEDENPLICRMYEDTYYSYSYYYDSNAFVLKPFAHVCLFTQLNNIGSIQIDPLEAEVDNMKEVYLLDIDNFDRDVYRETHNAFFQGLSSVSNEEEIFDVLISGVERQRNILGDKYPKQYSYCASVVTKETDASSLSHDEWACLKTSLKASAKYYDRYSSME